LTSRLAFHLTSKENPFEKSGRAMASAIECPHCWHSFWRTIGRSPDWFKTKNANASAVKREAEEDWGR
jgi:hypothetical protein